MYTGGLRDNKFNIVHNANSNVNIVVKTPVGNTTKESIKNVVIQDDVLCSKQVDMFGKECVEENKYTYLYKEEVQIPPLSMVDDIICISECGFRSVMINSYLRCKSSSKKLQFGPGKCKKIHIGKQHENFKCHPVFVDSWEERDKRKNDGKEIVEDVFVGQVVMEEADEDKYLGDIISKDGRNIKNIQARVNKGKGIVKRILEILEGIPFGKLYFQVAIILRNTLLVSSVLCNSEAWFNVTKAELELLETVDTLLLRSLLMAPKSVSKEMLYLELGVLPLREMIKQRRLNFLHYILSQDSGSLIYKVFQSQNKHRSKKDWISTVIADLVELDLKMKFENIQKISKAKWKSIVKNTIQVKTFEKLQSIKQTHVKVKDLEHISLEMQEYFMPNNIENVNKEETQLIFKIRCQVINVKMNMKTQYSTYECSICQEENESQKHIYECKEILKKKNDKSEMINYEEIMNGNVDEKYAVARNFRENMKIFEEMKGKT